MGRNLIIFSLLVFLVFLLFDRYGGKRPLPSNIYDTVYITTADTVFVEIKPDTIFRRVIVEVPTEIPIKVEDTVVKEIIMDYYSDVTLFDTLYGQDAVIAIKDVLHMNRLKNRQYSIKNLRESRVERVTIIEPKQNKYFLGGGVTLDNERLGYEIGGYLLNKKENLFGVTYDFPNKQLEFNAAIKIR